MYDHRVLPGVEVDGVASGGHHEVTVYDGVARLGVRLAQSPLRVRIGSRELSSDPSLLALTIDARATADAAMDEGRHGNPFSQLFGTALRWVRPDHVQLHAVYDENRLEGLLDGWEAETDDGKVEGGLRFDGTKVVEIEPHAGKGIVRDRARAALTHMLAGAQRPVLTLPVGTLRPRVDTRPWRPRHASAPAPHRDITLVTGHDVGRREAGATRERARHADRPAPPRRDARRGTTPCGDRRRAGAARVTAGRRVVRGHRGKHRQRRAFAKRATDRHGRGRAGDPARRRRIVAPLRRSPRTGTPSGRRRSASSARCRRSRPTTRRARPASRTSIAAPTS